MGFVCEEIPWAYATMGQPKRRVFEFFPPVAPVVVNGIKDVIPRAVGIVLVPPWLAAPVGVPSLEVAPVPLEFDSFKMNQASPKTSVVMQQPCVSASFLVEIAHVLAVGVQLAQVSLVQHDHGMLPHVETGQPRLKV